MLNMTDGNVSLLWSVSALCLDFSFWAWLTGHLLLRLPPKSSCLQSCKKLPLPSILQTVRNTESCPPHIMLALRGMDSSFFFLPEWDPN